jgi:hypothetical protein
MSASLIGRFGSSAFRLSTPAVSMSLAGSCFCPESAPRPFHHGVRERGGTIFGGGLAVKLTAGRGPRCGAGLLESFLASSPLGVVLLRAIFELAGLSQLRQVPPAHFLKSIVPTLASPAGPPFHAFSSLRALRARAHRLASTAPGSISSSFSCAGWMLAG